MCKFINVDGPLDSVGKGDNLRTAAPLAILAHTLAILLRSKIVLRRSNPKQLLGGKILLPLQKQHPVRMSLSQLHPLYLEQWNEDNYSNYLNYK